MGEMKDYGSVPSLAVKVVYFDARPIVNHVCSHGICDVVVFFQQ